MTDDKPLPAVLLLDLSRASSPRDVTRVGTERCCFLLQGSFAEVRVYSLGVFAVVSCLKRESYTVPPKGLSLKLPMDPRVCLSYLPGSFAAPVMAQTKVRTLHCGRLTIRTSGPFRRVRHFTGVCCRERSSCSPLQVPTRRLIFSNKNK